MATIPITKCNFGLVLPNTYNGCVPTLQAAAGGGDSFQPRNGKLTFLLVVNGDASTKTVTLTAQAPASDGHKNNVGPITVPAFATPISGVALIGPIEDLNLIDGTGFVQVTYSAVTNLKVAVIELAEKGRP